MNTIIKAINLGITFKLEAGTYYFFRSDGHCNQSIEESFVVQEFMDLPLEDMPLWINHRIESYSNTISYASGRAYLACQRIKIGR